MKNCISCGCELNSFNTAKNGTRNGVARFRKECKSCWSKKVIISEAKNIPKRRSRINAWKRKVGIVKQYPCETCKEPCYKKYSRPFCSDKCKFMAHVTVTGECWIWNKAKNKSGYGQSNFGSKKMPSHRLSYQLFNGPLYDNLSVCHTCDNPPCVNPKHLWLGTTQENKHDQIEKDRIGKKLDARDVVEIRKKYDNGISSQQIANLFNVTCSTITNIVKRRLWKHI